MSHSPSYYPSTIDGRAHWWQVIEEKATGVLTPLGYTTAMLAPILADAAWGVYLYGTIHRYFQSVSNALTQYEREILDGPNGGAMPDPVIVPTLPAAPAAVILCGIETRRPQWVGAIKTTPNYPPSVGAQIGIETPSNPFNPGTYPCQLSELASRGPHTVSGKFRKAGGHVDGINFYGRKSGTTPWQGLGRFNATPFTASVPLTTGAPEEWEFYAMAVRKDVEFGLASSITALIVRA